LGASANCITQPAKGVEDKLQSVESKVAWAGRSTSRVFGPALNFRAAFLAIVAVALSYAMALLAVVHAYRKAYGIVSKPELALRSMTRSFARICS
jgi:hypothetical protein